MAKKTWNSLTAQIAGGICRYGVVSSALPKGQRHDRQGKQLPTPYGLLLEWCALNLIGDWAAEVLNRKGGQTSFRLLLVLEVDAAKLDRRFGATAMQGTTPPPCISKKLLGYRDRDYGKLAAELGYSV